MSTLLEKIEANAAARLPLAANQAPSKEISRYRNFLKVESARLKILHRNGGSGREVCRGQAAVFDLLLRYILEDVRKNQPTPRGGTGALALVAIGGYGRGELNPQSDIDIMFLHGPDMVVNGKPNAYLAALTDGLLYPLWDLGIKVGHSVRTLEDCVKVANSDVQSKTSLIESRLVTGDAALFEKLRAVVVARCVRGFEQAYIDSRIEDQETRRAKFGNSATMQEPNIKNGCGGLRDYQNLLWMSYFKNRARSLVELQESGQITESERKQMDAAYDYLLRVRNELHYQMKRPVDVLSKSIQPAIAHQLGFHDRSPRVRLEKFMREVYSHMRNIYQITRTLEKRLALQRQPSRLEALRDLIRPGRLARKEQLVDGFKFVGGEIHAASGRVFKEQPRRLMRVFLHAQKRRLTLHPDMEQLIRNSLSLVDRAFLQDKHVHDTFLEILNEKGNVAPILRAMHDVGFLGKYMPEFGKLTCLVQHEFYHQYTTDEHTLVCLEQLDKIWAAKEAPYTGYTELLHQVERPFVLYLALLLHDAGKAYQTDDHSTLGAQLALRVAKRLGLDGATAHTLNLVIEHHLTMTQISQRRDLDDPSVIRTFAAQIQTAENLTILTLHTFADSMGTSNQLWNGFKDSLLRTFSQKTLEVLNGAGDFIKVEEKQRELLAEEVQDMVPPSFGKEEVQAHFDHLPSRYFRVYSARQIFSHLSLAHRFMHLQIGEQEKALEPIMEWHNEPDRGYSSVTICTWDRVGLFTKIAGSLTAAGLNILSAQIHTRTDGIIIDTFFVTDAKTAKLANREEKEKFESLLGQALTGNLDLAPLIAKQRPGKPATQSAETEKLPTVIRFDNGVSDYYTVIEVQTDDRVGLLYVISQTLSDLQLDISIAKISTEKGVAIDAFYVSKHDSQKVVSAEEQKRISDTLRNAIALLDG